MDRADPTSLIDLATSYWRSATLLAANRLGVFCAIGDGAMTAEEIARQCGAAEEPMEILLRAACCLGLLEREEERYRNSPTTGTFLVSGKPAYLGDGLNYLSDIYGAWGDLAEAIRSGSPGMDPEVQLGGDEGRTRSFVRGMHNRALATASQVVGHIELAGKRRLLDIGGGPGTYSLLLCQRYPELTADVVDLPAVTAVAAEIVREWQMEDRVTGRAGDYQVDNFGPGYDAVLISGVLHREKPDVCRDLVRRAARCLSPDGVCILADVFLNENSDGPEFTTLFALNMLLTSNDGRAHSWKLASGWLEEAGLKEIRVKHLGPPSPHTIVIGRAV